MTIDFKQKSKKKDFGIIIKMSTPEEQQKKETEFSYTASSFVLSLCLDIVIFIVVIILFFVLRKYRLDSTRLCTYLFLLTVLR